MFYVVLRCIWYRQKTRGRSPTLGGRFPPKRKKSIDLETVIVNPFLLNKHSDKMIVASPPTPSDMLTRIRPPPLPSKSSNTPAKVRIAHHPRGDDVVLIHCCLRRPPTSTFEDHER